MINFSDLDDEFIKDQYEEYLTQHIGNVKRGFEWIAENLPDIIPNNSIRDKIIYQHDSSKYSGEEFMPYAKYFYGKKGLDKVLTAKEIEKIDKDFDYAWLHHQRNNPHHWQYWVLLNDEDGTYALDMPYEYIIEMVCDHWAFSWAANNLYEIFNWYEKNKKKMVLSNKTRETYENILSRIKEILDSRI